jgi:hypothetical protein
MICVSSMCRVHYQPDDFDDCVDSLFRVVLNGAFYRQALLTSNSELLSLPIA